jgi:hypothetical protein
MARTAGSPAWAKSGGMAGRDGEFSPSRDDEENDERQFCRQICELEELRRCANEADPWSKNHCETINGGDLWLMHTDEAISVIDCEDVWH